MVAANLEPHQGSNQVDSLSFQKGYCLVDKKIESSQVVNVWRQFYLRGPRPFSKPFLY